MKKSIVVENLSKYYQVPSPELHSLSFRDHIQNYCSSFFHTKKEEQFYALKNVSFEVNEGEVFGIIGKNGSGKSTLLKILSQITHPSSGKAIINGRVTSLLEVGTGFHGDLTGRENIFLSGVILGMKKTEVKRQFDEIVSFAGVEKFIDVPVKKYSSGMRLRLAFSVAAHLQADIILMDEVLSVGDYQFEKKCLQKVEGIAGEGKTIIFVSHQLGAVRRLCDRVAFLEKGKVVAIGSPHDIVNSYLGYHSKTQSEATNIFSSNSVSIDKISLIGSGNGFFYKEYSLKCTINFSLKKENKYIVFFLIFKNSRGDILFSCSEIVGQSKDGLNRGVGDYRSTCQVPPYIFKTGDIVVTLKVCNFGNENKIIESNTIVQLDDIVGCKITSSILKKEKKEIWDQSYGLVSPHINWTVGQI